MAHLQKRFSSSAGEIHGRSPALADKIEPFRRLVLSVSLPILFIVFIVLLMPLAQSSSVFGRGGGSSPVLVGGRKLLPGGSVVDQGSNSYAVVFDAGSTGSRVHVFHFDEEFNLLKIGDDVEVFEQVKPGLSFYANDPQEAANSLIYLLEKAESVVPVELQPSTPVRVGATAGRRNLGIETSDQILQAVRDLLQNSSLLFKREWVAILDGYQEGSYLWVAINFLLKNFGKEYPGTVGVVDLGGGSVQMAYAISDSDAENAPNVPGEDPYVKPLILKGNTYHVYAHSYLNYGLLAARAEILSAGDDSYNYCILDAYEGWFCGFRAAYCQSEPFGL